MCFFQLAFPTGSAGQITSAGYDVPDEHPYSPGLLELLRHIFTIDPTTRPTAASLLPAIEALMAAPDYVAPPRPPVRVDDAPHVPAAAPAPKPKAKAKVAAAAPGPGASGKVKPPTKVDPDWDPFASDGAPPLAVAPTTASVATPVSVRLARRSSFSPFDAFGAVDFPDDAFASSPSAADARQTDSDAQ